MRRAHNCQRPRRRAIQYSRDVEIKARGRGVLDTPLARGMTTFCVGADAPHSQPSSPGLTGRSSIPEMPAMKSRSRGIPDTPLERVIGLAEGETQWLDDGSLRATRHAQCPHNSLALLNANEETRRVFSSRIKVRVIGGSARWLQFSRSQSRQLTPIGVA